MQAESLADAGSHSQENIYCDEVDEVDGLTCCLAKAVDSLPVRLQGNFSAVTIWDAGMDPLCRSLHAFLASQIWPLRCDEHSHVAHQNSHAYLFVHACLQLLSCENDFQCCGSLLCNGVGQQCIP